MGRCPPQKTDVLRREPIRTSLRRWSNGIGKVDRNVARIFSRFCCVSWLNQELGHIGVAAMHHDSQTGKRSARTPTDFVALLKFCAKVKDLRRGIQLHNDVLEEGLLEPCSDALITMYAKCGELTKAEELLNSCSSNDVHSWTDVIAACAYKGQSHAALLFFERMQREGPNPDAVTFACILKACGSLKELQKGKQIHEEVARQGLLKTNVFIGNALVYMYAKCGALVRAQQVLEELPLRDTVTWSTLISAYAQEGQGEQALNCFHLMQQEKIAPDALTYTCVLKACGIAKASNIGEQIHRDIVRQGLTRKDIVLGNALVDMYAKCGLFPKARELLKDLPVQTVFSWTTLIAGYVHHNEGVQALDAYQQMRCKGLYPNDITYLSILKACGSIKALDMGREIHLEIDAQRLLENNVVVGTALVDMYAKCGAFEVAQQVLEKLPAPCVSSWNALMTGYIQEDKFEQVLTCFELMQNTCLSPSSVTFLCILKALGGLKAADKGEKIHEEISRLGLLETDILLGNALVDMYAKCGALNRAQKVLEELSARDVVSWNSLIAGYAQHGQGVKALQCYQRMHCDGKIPNEVTFSCILMACGTIKAAAEGLVVHNEICRLGMLANNNMLGTALVDMYVKCGLLGKAQQVLDELPIQTTCPWTALIGGYIEQGEAEQALDAYKQMKGKGISPDRVTFLSALKACSILGTLSKGEQIHIDTVRHGLVSNDIAVGNALLNMYAKCGAFPKAERVFEELPGQSVMSWSALIEGYALHAQGEQALKCFEQMRHMGLCPDAVMFLSLLKACACIGAVERGEQLYDEITRQGLVGNNARLGNALVSMYAKCGDFSRAQGLLEALPSQDFVSWNALITGYAFHGKGEQALQCLKRMQQRGISPDAVTLLCILKACGSTGRAHDAHMYCSSMKMLYGINPDVKHYTCLVDVLGRSGHLDKAIKVIQKMDSSDHSIALWSSILGACEKWGDVIVGKWAFEHALRADERDPAAYILMANIYAAAGMQEHVKFVEALRIENEV